MKAIVRLIATSVLAFAVVCPAGASDVMTAHDLFRNCTTPRKSMSDAFESGYCMGFITGIAQAISKSKKLCMPADMTQGNMVEMFVTVMGSPESMEKFGNEPAGPVLAGMYEGLFKCKP